MQLIEYYTISDQDNILNQKLNCNGSQSSILQSDDLRFTGTLQNDNYETIIHLQFDNQQNSLRIKWFPIQKVFMKTTDKQKLSVLIRFALKNNSTTQCCKLVVSPRTGYFIIEKCNQLVENLNPLLTRQILTECAESFTNQCIQIMSCLYCILQLDTFDKYKFDAEHQQLALSKLFVKSSKSYCWKFLSEYPTQIYEESKLKFQKLVLCQKDEGKSQPLNLYFKQNISNQQRFRKLFRDEDYQLKVKHLQKSTTINQKSQQSCLITITNQALEFIKTKRQAKIHTEQLDTVKVGIENLKGKQIQRHLYERKIIQKFPTKEFIGIPVYYFLRNKPLQSLRITNLTFYKSLAKFLYTNNQTISVYTQLTLMYEIVMILRYLRDAGIVYHNLIKTNICIKKGLCINLIDYSNSYHTDVCKEIGVFKKIYNKLPYVNHLDILADERSDVYSFGMVAYEIFTGKQPHNIHSALYYKFTHKLTNKNIFSKLIKQPKISFQFMSKSKMASLIYLYYLFLQSISFKTEFQMNQPDPGENHIKLNKVGQKSKIIEERPYLDWIAICTKHTLDGIHFSY